LIMNKRFSTFLTGALFAAVVGVSAQPRTIGHDEVLRPVDVMSASLTTPSGYYNYSTAVNKLQDNLLYQLTDGSRILVQERNVTTGQLTLRLVEPSQAAINTSLWTIQGADGTYVRGDYFNFKNQETGVNLIVNPANAVDAQGNVSYSAANDVATIVDGCLEDWSWYASNDNGATAFDVDPVYAYYGANKESVIVFKENAAGYLVAVSYPSNVAGQNQVENISDAIQLKPVLANPIVLDASAINTVVDFQADGTLFPGRRYFQNCLFRTTCYCKCATGKHDECP
ncbi:MAG: hypothetical protein LUD74_02695, partial [Tannerellaceae bacterium]|nr:hypothetical protein [Tannerellaceae bacterium]